MKMLSDRMLAEDIIQTVFLKLFERLDKIKNKNSIQYYLFTSVRNEIYTVFRNKKIKIDQYNVSDTDDLETISEEDLEKSFEQNEFREILLRELGKLPPEQKDVFYLKEYGEMSYKEIAAIMNIDEGLVKSRLFKTRQKLIKRLANVINE